MVCRYCSADSTGCRTRPTAWRSASRPPHLYIVYVGMGVVGWCGPRSRMSASHWGGARHAASGMGVRQERSTRGGKGEGKEKQGVECVPAGITRTPVRPSFRQPRPPTSARLQRAHNRFAPSGKTRAEVFLVTHLGGQACA